MLNYMIITIKCLINIIEIDTTLSKKYIYNLIYLISFIGLVCYKWGTLYVHKLYYNVRYIN